MRKRLLTVLLMLCILAAMIYVGYEKKVFNPVAELEEEAGDKETIYFWYSDANMTDYFNSAAVAFGEQEDVRVIPVLTSDSEYLEALNQASFTDQLPDVFLVQNDSLEKAYLAGLASMIQDEKGLCTTSHYPQTAISAATYKDKLIAYPYYYETSVFLYNKTYIDNWKQQQIEKAEQSEEEDDSEYDAGEQLGVDISQMESGIPSTMDEVLVFADNYDAPENVEAVLRWDVSDIFYNYFFVGNYMVVGGECGDDETQISIDNAETKKCLEIYQNLNQFFYIESDTVTYDSVVQDFIDGKIVFTVATTDVVKKLEDAKADGSFAYEYGLTTIPQPSAELQGKSLSVTSCIVVNGYSENKKIANEFAAFLTGDYYQNLYDRTGKVSANLSANLSNPMLAVFMEEYQNASSLPKLIETSHFWIQLEILFSRVWEGGDAEALLRDLSTQVQSQFE